MPTFWCCCLPIASHVRTANHACFFLLQGSSVYLAAVCLTLVMSTLQFMFCCRADQYAWLLEGHTVSPSALGKSPLLIPVLHSFLLVLHCSLTDYTVLQAHTYAITCCGSILYCTLLCSCMSLWHFLSHSSSYRFAMRSAFNLAMPWFSVDTFQLSN